MTWRRNIGMAWRRRVTMYWEAWITDAIPTPGFEIPPYHVESYPIGSAVFNAQGFNCLSFKSRPGAKFTSKEIADEIAAKWNDTGMS